MAKAALFEPIRVRNSNLSNRIVIAPMCQYSAENGCMTDWHLIHLGHLSLSGAALLTIEATAVLPEGRITYADLVGEGGVSFGDVGKADMESNPSGRPTKRAYGLLELPNAPRMAGVNKCVS
jgi:hypothetical protein